MARPTKDTVEWIPHFVTHGKTLPILESRYGNDGYAVWFKLLETLGKSHGQTCNFSEDVEWQFFVTYARVSEEKADEILTLLAKLGAINRELWTKHRIVWSQNLVEFLLPLYQKRKVPAPEMPDPVGFPLRKPEENDVSAPETRRSEVKRSEVKRRKHKRAHARAGACEDQPENDPAQDTEPTDSEPSLDDIQNATRLMDAVNAIEPGYTKKARVNFDRWSNEFRLIRQQDHRPQADVVFVIENFPRHEFWSRNIRSPGALRGRTGSGADKFLKILADLKTKPGGTNGRAKNNAMPDPDSSRAVLAHFGVE